MKKRLSIILLLLTISLCSIVSIDIVWADKEYSTSVDHTGNGKTSPCKDGNCYTMGTGGIRIALVDANGQRVKNNKDELTNVVDLWYYGEGLDIVTFEGKIVIYNDEYRLRQNLPDYENISNDHIELVDTSTLTSIEEVFDGILDGMSNTHDSSSKIYPEQDAQLNVRIPNVTWEIMERITDKANEDNSYLDKLYTKLNIKASEVKEEYFLQVEPLIQWGNYELEAGEETGVNQYNSYKFLGTTSQLTLLFYGVDEHKISELCYGNSIGYVNKLGNGSCKNNTNGTGNRSAFNYINGFTSYNGSTNYYSFASVGIISTDTDSMPIKSDGNPFFETVNSGDYIGEDTGYDLIVEDTTNSKAYGVGFISLAGKVDESTCHSQAYNILSNAKYRNKMHETNGYYISLSGKSINATADLCTNPDLENDKIKETCCNSDGTLKSKQCPQLTADYLSNVGMLVTETEGDLCAPISCSDTIGTEEKDGIINMLYKNGYITNILEENSVYGRIINYFSKYATSVFSDGSSQQGLKFELWHDFFKDKAVCNYTPPECDPEKKDVSCGISNIFTINDSKDIANCIKAKFAYNDGSAGSLQSSIDNEYSYTDLNGVKQHGYCYEEVSFNLPQGGQTAVAGTVFKWGHNNNSDLTDKSFGTMEVKRTCYIPYGISETFKADEKYTFTSNWANVTGEEQYAGAGRINPEIKVIYKQAVDESNFTVNEISANLSVYLHKFESHTYAKNNTEISDWNYVMYNQQGKAISGEYGNTIKIPSNIIKDDGYQMGGVTQNPRTFTCNTNSTINNCNNIDRIEMIATYNIVYNDDFKWYADKANNGELNTNSNVEIESSYVFAGYGLPTPYITADNIYCESSYGVSGAGAKGTANGTGKLDVSVTNVGTKNQDGTGYHFDNLLKYKTLFIDDEDSVDNSSIDYYCDFKVSNPLFDFEYSSSSAAKCDPRTPKGIDVVFRTVDLISDADYVGDAFPGRSGLGERAKGANWAKYDNETIAQILSDDIYSQAPMYEITLDSPTIQMIRKWNNTARNAGYDPYTYMGEPADGLTNDSIGFVGYSIVDQIQDGKTYKSVRSRFLGALDRNLDNEHYNSICVFFDSDGIVDPSDVDNDIAETKHILNCNQSWWNKTKKNRITINITEKSIEE